MAIYGILKNGTVNTGKDEEIASAFATPLSIDSKKISYISETIGLKRLGYSNGAQRWEIEATIAASSSSAEYLVKSAVCGNLDPCFVRVPQPPETFSFSESAIITTSGANKGATNVPVSSALPVGMFIKFWNHSKVYLVKSYSGGSIGVFPQLLENVSGEIKYGSKVTMTCLFDTASRTGISYDNGILSSVSGVKLIERI